MARRENEAKNKIPTLGWVNQIKLIVFHDGEFNLMAARHIIKTNGLKSIKIDFDWPALIPINTKK